MQYLRKILIISFCVVSNFLFAQTFTEILGRPTDNSITVSILFNQSVNLYIEYGTQQGVYPNSTSVISNIANLPDEIDLTNLTTNIKYYYRTRYKLINSSTFLTGTEHSFYTQRAAGSTFTFTIESDEHLYDKKGVKSIYQICLKNQAEDKPDFMLSLGDIFGDDHYVSTMTSGKSDTLHRNYLPFIGSICHSIPFYVCLGNHEGEFDYYLAQNPPNNIAVWGTLFRKLYYPNPIPNNFYSGNTDVEPYSMGNPENYYAWNWGNALFVVMDVYRNQCDTSAKPTNWNWSLGLPQYTWLKNTLENSTAQYKFVFAHHVSGQGRGAAVQAKLFEWGGYDQNGNYNFNTKRPGWSKPIHKLFVDNGVNIFFQGHDHLFAHEILDGVIYQETPMPSDSTYEIGMLANADAYTSDTIGGTGHLRVTVSPACVKVDFVRAYLPADTLTGLHHNGEVAFSYTIGNCSTSISEKSFMEVNLFPNPAKDNLYVQIPENIDNYLIKLYNAFGQMLLQTKSTNIDLHDFSNGIYILSLESKSFKSNKKLIINR
ncbi:MAG: T9SS type A sorting domain-containing protein [Bacteroidales bacterium]